MKYFVLVFFILSPLRTFSQENLGDISAIDHYENHSFSTENSAIHVIGDAIITYQEKNLTSNPEITEQKKEYNIYSHKKTEGKKKQKKTFAVIRHKKATLEIPTIKSPINSIITASNKKKSDFFSNYSLYSSEVTLSENSNKIPKNLIDKTFGNYTFTNLFYVCKKMVQLPNVFQITFLKKILPIRAPPFFRS